MSWYIAVQTLENFLMANDPWYTVSIRNSEIRYLFQKSDMMKLINLSFDFVKKRNLRLMRCLRFQGL